MYVCMYIFNYNYNMLIHSNSYVYSAFHSWLKIGKFMIFLQKNKLIKATSSSIAVGFPIAGDWDTQFKSVLFFKRPYC